MPGSGDDEVDTAGITMLTMTKCKSKGHRRSASWTNTALPPLMLEDAPESPGVQTRGSPLISAHSTQQKRLATEDGPRGHSQSSLTEQSENKGIDTGKRIGKGKARMCRRTQSSSSITATSSAPGTIHTVDSIDEADEDGDAESNNSTETSEHASQLAGREALAMDNVPSLCASNPNQTNVDVSDEGDDGLREASSLLAAPMEILRERSNSDTRVMLSHAQNTTEQRKKTLAYWRLEKEYRELKDRLVAKVDECHSLEAHSEKLTSEMDDLAESLFTEAHNMVDTAKEEAVRADKRCKEATSKSEVLQAEVLALKAVVEYQREEIGRLRGLIAKSTTSTLSSLSSSSVALGSTGIQAPQPPGLMPSSAANRRGRVAAPHGSSRNSSSDASTNPTLASPASSPSRGKSKRLSFIRRKLSANSEQRKATPAPVEVVSVPPPDPLAAIVITDAAFHDAFVAWFKTPSLESPFVEGLVSHEMLLVLAPCGNTAKISHHVIMAAVKDQSVLIEACRKRDNSTSSSKSDQQSHVERTATSSPIPESPPELAIEKEEGNDADADADRAAIVEDHVPPCMLSGHGPRTHRVRLSIEDDWVYISTNTRDRIATVCDCYLYLRYITQGLVSSCADVACKKLAAHRHRMMKALIGLSLDEGNTGGF